MALIADQIALVIQLADAREDDVTRGALYDVATRASAAVREEHDPTPIEMLLVCPVCGRRHIDEGEFAHKRHHTHSCQHCGTTWRPAVVPTVGVRFLPGFKNASAPVDLGEKR